VPHSSSIRRPAPARSLAAALIAAGAAVLLACSAPARAATNVSGDVVAFTLTPTASTAYADPLQAASDPNLTAALTFGYGTNTTDSVKNISVTLPPGLLAAPVAVSATCSGSQLTAFACPAGSQIGTATGHAKIDGTATQFPLQGTLYLMPPTASADVAELGVVIDAPKPTAFAPVASASGPVRLLTTTPDKPQLVMSVDNLPASAQLSSGGSATNFQIIGMSVTIDGVGTAKTPFTRLPSLCQAAVATVNIDTHSATADGAGTATITPDGCPNLPYAPKLTAAGAKDAADSGVAVLTKITQAANEATSSRVTLMIPSSVTPNVGGALGTLCSSATFAGCTAVGAATATSPLVGQALPGAVYLTPSPTQGALVPQLTVVFPAPFGLELTGAVGITTNSVTFANVPDVPLTSLTVALKGGTTGLFQTSCNPVTSLAITSFTDQNGDKTVPGSAVFTVSGCPTTTIVPGAPTLSSVKLSNLKNGKPSLSFKVAAGANGAPDLSSVGVRLPHGLKFEKAGLKKGVKVSGGSSSSVSIKGGKLVIALKIPVPSFGVRVSASALKESSSLKRQARKRKKKTLRIGVVATDSTGATTSLTSKVKI
jgi:hypothetical protein